MKIYQKKRLIHTNLLRREKMASDTYYIVQKLHKKKVVQQKEIGKEIKEVVASTILMPFRKRNGITP